MSIECEMNIVRPEDYTGPAFDPEWKGDPVPDDEDRAPVQLSQEYLKRLMAAREASALLRNISAGYDADSIIQLADWLLMEREMAKIVVAEKNYIPAIEGDENE